MPEQQRDEFIMERKKMAAELVSQNKPFEAHQKLLEMARAFCSFGDFLMAHNLIKDIELPSNEIPKDKIIKIALLSSFTIEPVKLYLDIKCRLAGLFPFFYIGEYNQYHQEILNPESGLYGFGPDIAILALHPEAIFPDIDNLFFETPPLQRRKEVKRAVDNLLNLANNFTKKSKALLIIHNFPSPAHPPLGILDTKQNYGLAEMFRDLNTRLARTFIQNSQVFILDYDLLTSNFGKDNVTDEKMDFLAQMKISKELIPRLCEAYLSYVSSLKGMTRKCLVLDLDNTLWGGIIGEDGFEGIQLGPTPPGNAYYRFQKSILNLYRRGIVLAINSRNNYDDAVKVLKEHPFMILREGHFASLKINWNDKITNMKQISQELKIGLDSMAFVDDDPANRDLMKQLLPSVLTLDMGQDPSLYPKVLEGVVDFDTIYLTEEDKKRPRMYVEERHREELKQAYDNLEEFFYSLDMKARIQSADKFSISRISQLTQRTNQFNLTTKRYSEAEIEKFVASKDHQVYSLKLEDKFGDSGIVGVAVIVKEPQRWIIDSFLLSCRALGRGVEKCLLSYVAEKAQVSQTHLLIGEFIQTKKNVVCQDFYKNNHFQLEKEEGGRSMWILNLKEATLDFPKWISLKG